MFLKPLHLAVGAMLVQQAFSTMSGFAVLVIAPVIAADLGLNPGLTGVYTAMVYGTAMFSSLGGGGFLLRFGALRTSQACLAIIAAGLVITAPGTATALAAAAILIGIGSGPATPASSHILARYAPPRQLGLVFSIKQTGVPLGGVLAGLLLPLFAAGIGWRGALAATAAMCLVLALALQPFRAEFDSDRRPEHSLGPGDLRATLMAVMRDRRLRELCVTMFAYTGLQFAFAAFFVLFVTQRLGMSLAAAGIVFAVAQGSGILGRIFWGWIGGRYLPLRPVIAMLGIGMAASGVAIALMTPDWPVAAIAAVAIVFGLTGISYQGVLLAETARLSPPGMAGVMVGGAAFSAYSAMVAMPSLFGAIVATTGGYSAGFLIASVPPLAMGLWFLLPRPAD